MPLFKRNQYRTTVLVPGAGRYRLRMYRPAETMGINGHNAYMAKCEDYAIYGLGKTKGQADQALRVELGLEAPKPQPKPQVWANPVPDADHSIKHFPAGSWYGRPTPPKSNVYGLTEVCEALASDRARSLPDCPGTVKFYPAKGKEPAKFQITADVLPEFWELVNEFHGGETIRITDKTQGSGDPIVVKVGE